MSQKEQDFTTNIVNALQNEYNEVFARTRSIDTRASILISVLTAILPLYFGVLNWNRIHTCLIAESISFRQAIMLCTFFISILTLIISFCLSIATIRCRQYDSFPTSNYENFSLQGYYECKATVNAVNTSIIASYVACINKNSKVIEKKARWFFTCMISAGVYILLSISTTILNLL